jgi:RHH-type proline utilization regulon transcriptional repressor/proline dehydrogenase/delta 1-pyrroline-5-carboxylate dehydrogenase
MQSLLREYDLSSQEGVLLMCVAEALLRIPDAATADKLIRDKLSQGDWEKHVGKGKSLLVNAGTWGMMLTGKLVSVDAEKAGNTTEWFARLAARAGEPVVRLALRQGMKLMAEQFVMGRTIGDALARSLEDGHVKYMHSFDMLGEACLHRPRCRALLRGIRNGDRRDRRLSQGPRWPRVPAPGNLHQAFRAAPALRTCAARARHGRAHAARRSARRRARARVTSGSRSTPRRPIAWASPSRSSSASSSPRRFPAGKASASPVQAYQKRAPFVVDWLAELARRGKRRIVIAW